MKRAREPSESAGVKERPPEEEEEEEADAEEVSDPEKDAEGEEEDDNDDDQEAEEDSLEEDEEEEEDKEEDEDDEEEEDDDEDEEEEEEDGLALAEEKKPPKKLRPAPKHAAPKGDPGSHATKGGKPRKPQASKSQARSEFLEDEEEVKESKRLINFEPYLKMYLQELDQQPPKPQMSRTERWTQALRVFTVIMRDRGHDCSELDDQWIEDTFQSGHWSKVINGKTLMLHIISSPKFGVSEARAIIDLTQEEETLAPVQADEVVVICEPKPTTQALSELEFHVASQRATLSLFRLEELNRPYAHHYLVPRHIKEEDPDAVLKRLRCKRECMPILSVNDAITKYYGWPKGTIVRIERKRGGYNQTKDYWRCVGHI